MVVAVGTIVAVETEEDSSSREMGEVANEITITTTTATGRTIMDRREAAVVAEIIGLTISEDSTNRGQIGRVSFPSELHFSFKFNYNIREPHNHPRVVVVGVVTEVAVDK